MSSPLTSYSLCDDQNRNDSLDEFLIKLARFGIDQCVHLSSLILHKQRILPDMSTHGLKSNIPHNKQIEFKHLSSQTEILKNEFHYILLSVSSFGDYDRNILFTKLQNNLSKFVDINMRLKLLDSSIKDVHSKTMDSLKQSLDSLKLSSNQSDHCLSTDGCLPTVPSIRISTSFFSDDDIHNDEDIGKQWRFSNIINTRFHMSLIASDSYLIIGYNNLNHFLHLTRVDGPFQGSVKWKHGSIVDLHWCSLIHRYVAVTHQSIYTIEYTQQKPVSSNSIVVNKVLDLEIFYTARLACNEQNILLYTTQQSSSFIYVYDNQFRKEKALSSLTNKELPINSNSFCCTNTLVGLTEKNDITVSYFPYVTPKKVSFLLFDIDTFHLCYTVDLNNCSTVYSMKSLEKYNVFFGISDEKLLWIIKLNKDGTIQMANKTFYTNQNELCIVNNQDLLLINANASHTIQRVNLMASTMTISLLLLLTLMLVSIDGAHRTHNPSMENTRPIIGILTQPISTASKKPNRTTYLVASYVKYVESTGAQVVPIRMYQPIDYYLHLYNSLNGILFPGGDYSDEYFYVAKLFYTWSLKDFDEKQKIFPIWGTCEGFEMLLMITKGSINILDLCNGYDYATELTFMPDAVDSQLFGRSLPENIKNALEYQPTTSNYHNFCMRPENFTADPILSSFYRMLSISADREGRAFVSTIESFRYPIFAVQWHPEKNGFEWRVNTTIPHSTDAISVMQYMANFFTNQTRQNMNRFDSIDDETKYLIYQYTPIFTDLYESHFQQIYYFYE